MLIYAHFSFFILFIFIVVKDIQICSNQPVRVIYSTYTMDSTDILSKAASEPNVYWAVKIFHFISYVQKIGFLCVLCISKRIAFFVAMLLLFFNFVLPCKEDKLEVIVLPSQIL